MTEKNLKPKTKDLSPNKNFKKILVTGANGQLGFKIRQLLSKDYDLILTDIDTLDITDQNTIDNFIKERKPDFIIHAAAYTQVDKAEDDPVLCNKINIDGTKNIAKAAKKHSSTLIYISTDYVFDGKGGTQGLGLRTQGSPTTQDPRPKPYTETDTPNPLSVYGKSKLAGEKAVQKICKKYYIIRTSWLFGQLPESHPCSNFVETMLRLASEKNELKIVNDQIGSPTYTYDLVNVIDKIIRSQDLGLRTQESTNNPRPKTQALSPVPFGIYHFSGNSKCSWYDFAKEIFKITKNNIELKPIVSSSFPQKAKRPSYSYLSKNRIEQTLNIKVRTWQEMLKSYLSVKRR